MGQLSAVVVTVSDGVTRGERTDESGPAVSALLTNSGFDVSSRLVADERPEIERAIREESSRVSLIVTTGGTGFATRDVTPEATRAVIDRDAPGLAEAMRAAGRTSTPFADLSRGVAGIVGSTLVLNLPGSPRGAVESLQAVLEILPHALEHLGGRTGHPGGAA
jgi:molybdenum cofactor synthesis domain-containing protein